MNKSQKPRLRVSALVEKDGKFLLVKEFIKSRGGIFWLTPGGGVEFGETLEKALKREIKEETGIKIKAGAFYAIKEWIVEKNIHSVCLYFKAKAIGGKLKKEAEAFDIGFFTKEEMKKIGITPFTKELFGIGNGTRSFFTPLTKESLKKIED